MHMRAAMPLLGCLLLATALSGCLGVDNMAEFKSALGFGPEPLPLDAPVARLRASPTLALVGQAVAFSAVGSLDPQGLPLDFAWDFGDGATARGEEVSHRYAAPGAFQATLTAISRAGLAGTDALVVTVVANRPPAAALAVLRDGAPVERALAGEVLAFEAEVRDPEGQPLEVRWAFGDGATANGPAARHAYERGGRYLVAVVARDPGGLAATAEAWLPVDHLVGGEGEVAVLRDATAHAVPVAPGATGLRIAAGFDAFLGANALTVRVQDARGAPVAAATFQPPPGTQGLFEAALDLAGADLQGHAPGDWTLVVQRASGVRVPYAFTAEVRY